MVNGVTSSQVSAAYTAYSSTAKANKDTTESKATSKASDVAATYEPSEEGKKSAKTYTQNTELVNQLKLDAETRTQNLQSLVQKLMSQQATTYGNATDIWSFLREGKFTVDPETKAQAQADIAEDGYWGVEKTSDRIVSFATALTGGDPSKLDSMIDAFKKGFAQAEKTWGGELPEISQKTYGAVLQKFEDLKKEYGLTEE
ncbi:MAG: hypothetical protein MJ104_02390 [Lachnospiraceae bacterium]|nr:hypothetical protein [Lachnospiraceae bacterium]